MICILEQYNAFLTCLFPRGAIAKSKGTVNGSVTIHGIMSSPLSSGIPSINLSVPDLELVRSAEPLLSISKFLYILITVAIATFKLH